MRKYSICFFLVKNDIDMFKTCSNLLSFYLTNSMNFNAEIKTLMRFDLDRWCYKIGAFFRRLERTA